MKSHTGVPENEQVLEGQFVCFFRDLRNRLLQLVKGLHVNDTSLVWMSIISIGPPVSWNTGQPGRAEWEYVFLCLPE